jgi:carbon storage regulator CsrA
MLCLSRCIGESVEITIGNTIVLVTVCEAWNGRARLGFSAPEHVAIHRSEIAGAIRAAGQPVRPGGNLARRHHDTPTPEANGDSNS